MWYHKALFSDYDVKVRPLKGVVYYSVVLSAARGEEEPVSGPGAAPEPAPRHGARVCGAMCHCSVPSVDCVVSRS